MPRSSPPAPVSGANEVPALLTSEQLAQAIPGLTVQEIDRARTHYGLPYLELGPKKFRFRLEDALAWLTGRRTTKETAPGAKVVGPRRPV